MPLPIKISFAAALLLAPAAQAQQSLALDYVYWGYRIEGSATDGDGDIDFERDLNVQPRTRGSYTLDWRTGAGPWPDLMARYMPLRAGGMNTAAPANDPLGGLIGGDTATVIADADFKDWRLTLQYPLLDAELALQFAAGLTLRQLRGDILIQDEEDAQPTRERVRQTFPMAHLQGEWRLREWLSLRVAGDYVTYEDDRAADYCAELRMSWGALRFSGGWQHKAFRFRSDSYLLDAELTGPFAALGFAL